MWHPTPHMSDFGLGGEVAPAVVGVARGDAVGGLRGQLAAGVVGEGLLLDGLVAGAQRKQHGVFRERERVGDGHGVERVWD